jgi:hypothetical protein
MESSTLNVSHDSAGVDTTNQESYDNITLQKRKYAKRKAEDKNRIKFKPISCEWHNILAQNKLVVSMNTEIFQQDVVIRQANAVFLQNFGFINAAHAAGDVNARAEPQPRGAIGLPFRALIGDTPMTMDLDKCMLEKWTLPVECPTSNRVLTNVTHSMTSGTNTSFFCTLVDSCNRPMFCHMQCVPIINHGNSSKATKPETKPDNYVNSQSTKEKIQNIFWAVLTIHCASQIGCAMQFGIGYGLKPNQRYSDEVKQAFRRAHETNLKGVVARAATDSAIPLPEGVVEGVI